MIEQMLRDIKHAFGEVGLALNASKCKVQTNAAERCPPLEAHVCRWSVFGNRTALCKPALCKTTLCNTASCARARVCVCVTLNAITMPALLPTPTQTACTNGYAHGLAAGVA